MRHQIKIVGIILTITLITAASCEKEDGDFTQIKVIETQIYNEIKSYRIANGISENTPFVNQPIMVKEAQIFSARMGMTEQGLDTTGVSLHWKIIHDKIGGENDLTLIQSTSASTAADIVAAWTSDEATSQLMLGNFTQCGVGVETGTDQLNYVTVFMMLYQN